MRRTAASEGLASCHRCHCLSPIAQHACCPRCGHKLHLRKPKSLSRTWALLVAASILYIPANLLPIMTTTSLGRVQSDTIMSGVIYLLHSGMWPLALIVFVASIFVPVLKLIVLSYLLISVQRKSTWQPKERVRLYKITEFVGRWSMIDVYVVAVLVSLVQMGNLANIEPGLGIVAFGAVVVLTLLAANSFDPRLIWDAMEPQADENQQGSAYNQSLDAQQQ